MSKETNADEHAIKDQVVQQRKKIASLKESYNNKISLMEIHRSFSKFKNQVISPFSTKNISGRGEGIDSTNRKLSLLKEEKEKVLTTEKKKLENLKEELNNIRPIIRVTKEREGVNKKITSIGWFNDNKPILVIVTICLIVGLVTIIRLFAVVSEEEKQDYFINTEESYSFDCNLQYDESNRTYYCIGGEIVGSFSNSHNIEFKDSSESNYHIEGNTFTRNTPFFISDSLYHDNQFSRSNLETINTDIDIVLRNIILMKDVTSKRIHITYRLSQSEVDILESENTKWRSANLSSQHAIDNRSDEEKSEAEAEDNGEELPDDISPYDVQALCERGFESLGYPNPKISLTNQYAMGYPPYIYVIVGTLSYKEGTRSSRVQVGRIQCQANWKTWSIKSITINGQVIF
ncbi:hypothetical protein IKG12_01530 [Candidatus Saccharibacteria bacterium]|nr:hypothetical protein [Candidatus Saccharibacteria bacterium]